MKNIRKIKGDRKVAVSARKFPKDYLDIPRSVQDAIPISRVYEDGIFRIGKMHYSKTYRFEDINYQVAAEEDKEMMYESYCSLLNSFDSSVSVKISINNRKINRTDFFSSRSANRL